MGAHIAVIGASLGGLVAAAVLRERGHDVTIIQQGRTVGGLYSKTATPFGTQELGMHVVYASDRHYRYLCDIFGAEVFRVLRGHRVDIGGSANFGRVFFNSHYPNLLEHPMRERVLEELRRRPDPSAPATNAREAAQQRFGVTGADAIVRPTLEKLWGSPAEALSPHALHCFYDLRRLVVCEKADADRLKQDPRLDEVIANPDQSRPAGEVFGGRVGLTFRTQVDDLEQRVSSWADRVGITLRFGANVSARDGVLAVDDQPVSGTFDACIMAVPLHQFLDATHVGADRMELSICYVQLTEHVDDRFPSYYVLAHDPAFRASRIVNYDAYNGENPPDRPSVLAIEAVHAPDAAPSVDALTAELRAMFPHLTVDAAWALPRSVPVLSPTVRNGRLLDALQASLAAPFADKPVFFTGMRTDTGVFFSHHTIGLAHDSALACHARLA